jgi:hypothetical protein
MDGPVVVEAKIALENGDVTPILKWVMKEHEGEIREAFDLTVKARSKGPEVHAMADIYFFETLVRIHREGEGAPYTGVKPAGTDPGEAVRAADRSLEIGSVDQLATSAAKHIEDNIRKRYQHVVEKKQHSEESVEAGREYVAAYVEYFHYVMAVHDIASGHAHHQGEGAESAEEAEHEHEESDEAEHEH